MSHASVELEPLTPFSDNITVKLNLNLQNSLKVRPPLVKLPAFSVDAVVLSFAGFEDEVIALLTLLNRNCKLYAYSHKDYLKAFLVKYKKVISHKLEFNARPAEE